MTNTKTGDNMDNLDNVELEVVDGRQLALLIRVTTDGNIRFTSQMSKLDTADYLRRMADSIEAQA